MRINLLHYTCKQMEDFFTEIGEKTFHGRQIFKWLHQYGVTELDKMTDLSKSLRQKLKQMTEVRVPEMAHEQKSVDGTRKWLLRLIDGNCI